MSSCKSCNAPLLWVKTSDGKPMPCNPEPVLSIPAGEAIVLKVPGKHAIVVKAPADRPLAIGFQSHWATCPDAQSWRKT